MGGCAAKKRAALAMNGEVACGELGSRTKSFQAEIRGHTEPDSTIAGEIEMETACENACLCALACVCV